MRSLLPALCTAAIALASHDAQAQTVEPPKTWATCAACHAAEGSAAIGPSLRGVAGRKAGSLPGFGYSRAMKSAGITWDDESLAAFITDPQQVVPGNRMPFSGAPDPAEVAAIVRYLKTLQ